MSLFQCQRCGCCENTALSGQGCDGFSVQFFDWTGIEDRKGLKLCSACGPTRYRDGTPTKYGTWHGQFARKFLPMGDFHTNRAGNLEHTATGRDDWHAFAIEPPGVAKAQPTRWCPECRSSGVVGIEQDVCPTCDGTGKVAASGVACTRPVCQGQPRCETCCAADAAAGVKTLDEGQR